jgi:hypothetical protein
MTVRCGMFRIFFPVTEGRLLAQVHTLKASLDVEQVSCIMPSVYSVQR